MNTIVTIDSPNFVTERICSISGKPRIAISIGYVTFLSISTADSVITSYSIHYTKLYDLSGASRCCTPARWVPVDENNQLIRQPERKRDGDYYPN